MTSTVSYTYEDPTFLKRALKGLIHITHFLF